MCTSSPDHPRVHDLHFRVYRFPSRYLPFDVKIQRQAFAEMKTDKLTFDGFERVATHPLEDPQFVAFAKS